MPSGLRRRLRDSLVFDVYTQEQVPKKIRSIEHLIPARLFQDRQSQHDPRHLFMTSAAMNRFRSDFRFGGSLVRRGRQPVGPWEELDGCFRNRNRRLFFPRTGHRLIAHTVQKMLASHPVLRGLEQECFESVECFQEWLAAPWTPMEVFMRDSHQAWFCLDAPPDRGAVCIKDVGRKSNF